jgi:hypothetical protein
METVETAKPMERICIIDVNNMDIGLKVLFKTADYCVINQEPELQWSKHEAYNRLGFRPIVLRNDLIIEKPYDTIYIIYPLIHSYVGSPSFLEKFNNYWLFMLQLFANNNIRISNGGKMKIIDNYDYNYCPINDVNNIQYPKDVVSNCNFTTTFYKRNKSKKGNYSSNVKPFPFIIFGYQSPIDVLLGGYRIDNGGNKINKLFFYGAFLIHNDPTYNVFINRKIVIDKIRNKFDDFIEINEPRLTFEEYIYKMSQYKFALDLLGVGEPNKRTFEILSCNTLMISQKGNIDWGFDDGDDFSEETVFSGDNVDELYDKLQHLINNDALYKKCLENQIYLRQKYMSRDALIKRLSL